MNRRWLLAGTAAVAILCPRPAYAWTHGVALGTTYYVSPTGSDSNDGKSQGAAWQTITKVNASTFGAGDRILFQGGQTFSGALSMGTANWSGSSVPNATYPVTFGSYGAGNATISSGSSSGFAALNIGALVVRDLTFVGGGIASTTVNGVSATNSQGGNTKLQFVRLTNLDVSQYGGNGILITGTSGTSGFNDVVISACSAHDNTGGVTPGTGTAGIFVTSVPGYGFGATTPAHTNVTISGCTAAGNTGKAGDALNWVGSGIVIAQTTNGLISACSTSNNGQNSTLSSAGPVGCWTADSKNIVIQLCESFGNKTGGSIDGGGFDMDGGCVDCAIQYCYSHGNAGSGFLVYSYNDGTVTAVTGCTIRYCISENDVIDTSQTTGSINVGSDAVLTGVAVYNNTVYQSRVGPSVMAASYTLASTITGNVANNIFYTASGVKLAAVASNPTGLLFTGNDYFTLGSFSLTWNGVTYSSFAAWQTATSQEKISGSNVGLTSNPLLTNPGGGTSGSYVLQVGSPMIGVGINLTTQFSISQGSRDYVGNAIPNGIGTGYNVGSDGAHH